MNKLFNSTEEVVSMFLGLVIVVVIVGLVFNFFQRSRGSISLPGVTDSNQLKVAGDTDVKKNTTLENKNNEYVVKPGDSLWKIAAEELGSGYRWTDIAKENKLKNVRILVVGQKLLMPQKETAITPAKNTFVATESGSYVVVKGDSLWKIAVAKYADGYRWINIWNENKIKLINPSKLEIGMELILPSLK